MSEKILTSFLTFILGVQPLLANLSESNFWKERQRTVQNRGENRSQLASLPASFGSLPALNPVNIPKSIPRLESSISLSFLPSSVAKRCSDILAHLSANDGTVRKITAPHGRNSGVVVVHIQDVHQNLEAQTHIGNVVTELTRSGSIDLLGLEGDFSRIDLAPFLNYPKRDTIHKVADYLFREKEISGPIHALLTAEVGSPVIVGIDDEAAYGRNVEAYRASRTKLEGAKSHLERLLADLRDQKKNLNLPLQRFDSWVESYRAETISLQDYLRAIKPFVPRLSVQLQTYLDVAEMESKLDDRKIESERERLLTQLLTRLSPDETSSLLQHCVAFRAGQLRHTDFYAEIKAICSRKNLDLARYPAMEAYLQYILKVAQIDGSALFSEVSQFEKRIYANLAQTAEEKMLVQKLSQARLTRKLLGFALTPEEWKEYNRNDGRPSTVDGRFSSFKAFYEEAEHRDQEMAANLEKAISERRAQTAILVTGGFHADGLVAHLLKSGATVISFVPKLTRVDGPDAAGYLSVFAQEKTPLQKLFEGEKLFLASSSFPSFERNLGFAAKAILVEEAESNEDLPNEKEQSIAKSLNADSRFSISAADGAPRQALEEVMSADGTVNFSGSIAENGDFNMKPISAPPIRRFGNGARRVVAAWGSFVKNPVVIPLLFICVVALTGCLRIPVHPSEFKTHQTSLPFNTLVPLIESVKSELPLDKHGLWLTFKDLAQNPQRDFVSFADIVARGDHNCFVAAWVLIDRLKKEGFPLDRVTAVEGTIPGENNETFDHIIVEIEADGRMYVAGLSLFDQIIFGRGVVPKADFLKSIPWTETKRVPAARYLKAFGTPNPRSHMVADMPPQKYLPESDILISTELRAVPGVPKKVVFILTAGRYHLDHQKQLVSESEFRLLVGCDRNDLPTLQRELRQAGHPEAILTTLTELTQKYPDTFDVKTWTTGLNGATIEKEVSRNTDPLTYLILSAKMDGDGVRSRHTTFDKGNRNRGEFALSPLIILGNLVLLSAVVISLYQFEVHLEILMQTLSSVSGFINHPALASPTVGLAAMFGFLAAIFLLGAVDAIVGKQDDPVNAVSRNLTPSFTTDSLPLSAEKRKCFKKVVLYGPVRGLSYPLLELAPIAKVLEKNFPSAEILIVCPALRAFNFGPRVKFFDSFENDLIPRLQGIIAKVLPPSKTPSIDVEKPTTDLQPARDWDFARLDLRAMVWLSSGVSLLTTLALALGPAAIRQVFSAIQISLAGWINHPALASPMAVVAAALLLGIFVLPLLPLSLSNNNESNQPAGAVPPVPAPSKLDLPANPPTFGLRWSNDNAERWDQVSELNEGMVKEAGAALREALLVDEDFVPTNSLDPLETPLVPLPSLSRSYGIDDFMKAEFMLPRRAFKFRAQAKVFVIFQRIAARSKAILRFIKKVITASTGNHGLNTAYAVSLIKKLYPGFLADDFEAEVLTTPDIRTVKRDSIQAEGARLLHHNQAGIPFKDYDDGNAAAREMDQKKTIDAHGVPSLIHVSHGDAMVLAGYATAAEELFKQLWVKYGSLENLRTKKIAVVVPGGSGGNAAGIAWMLKKLKAEYRLDIRVYTVQTENVQGLSQSLMAGKPVRVPITDEHLLKEDGIGVGTPEELALEILLKTLDGNIVVPSQDLVSATHAVWRDIKTSADPKVAGSRLEVTCGMTELAMRVAPAAFADRDVVVGIGTGGNVAQELWDRIGVKSRQATSINTPPSHPTHLPARQDERRGEEARFALTPLIQVGGGVLLGAAVFSLYRFGVHFDTFTQALNSISGFLAHPTLASPARELVATLGILALPLVVLSVGAGEGNEKDGKLALSHKDFQNKLATYRDSTSSDERRSIRNGFRLNYGENQKLITTNYFIPIDCVTVRVENQKIVVLFNSSPGFNQGRLTNYREEWVELVGPAFKNPEEKVVVQNYETKEVYGIYSSGQLLQEGLPIALEAQSVQLLQFIPRGEFEQNGIRSEQTIRTSGAFVLTPLIITGGTVLLGAAVFSLYRYGFHFNILPQALNSVSGFLSHPTLASPASAFNAVLGILALPLVLLSVGDIGGKGEGKNSDANVVSRDLTPVGGIGVLFLLSCFLYSFYPGNQPADSLFLLFVNGSMYIGSAFIGVFVRQGLNSKAFNKANVVKSLRYGLSIGLLAGFFLYGTYLPLLGILFPAEVFGWWAPLLKGAFDLSWGSLVTLGLIITLGELFGENQNWKAGIKSSLDSSFKLYPYNFVLWFPIVVGIWMLQPQFGTGYAILHNIARIFVFILFSRVLESAAQKHTGVNLADGFKTSSSFIKFGLKTAQYAGLVGVLTSFVWSAWMLSPHRDIVLRLALLLSQGILLMAAAFLLRIERKGGEEKEKGVRSRHPTFEDKEGMKGAVTLAPLIIFGGVVLLGALVFSLYRFGVHVDVLTQALTSISGFLSHPTLASPLAAWVVILGILALPFVLLSVGEGASQEEEKNASANIASRGRTPEPEMELTPEPRSAVEVVIEKQDEGVTDQMVANVREGIQADLIRTEYGRRFSKAMKSLGINRMRVNLSLTRQTSRISFSYTGATLGMPVSYDDGNILKQFIVQVVSHHDVYYRKIYKVVDEFYRQGIMVDPQGNVSVSSADTVPFDEMFSAFVTRAGFKIKADETQPSPTREALIPKLESKSGSLWKSIFKFAPGFSSGFRQNQFSTSKSEGIWYHIRCSWVPLDAQSGASSSLEERIASLHEIKDLEDLLVKSPLAIKVYRQPRVNPFDSAIDTPIFERTIDIRAMFPEEIQEIIDTLSHHERENKLSQHELHQRGQEIFSRFSAVMSFIERFLYEAALRGYFDDDVPLKTPSLAKRFGRLVKTFVKRLLPSNSKFLDKIGSLLIWLVSIFPFGMADFGSVEVARDDHADKSAAMVRALHQLFKDYAGKSIPSGIAYWTAEVFGSLDPMVVHVYERMTDGFTSEQVNILADKDVSNLMNLSTDEKNDLVTRFALLIHRDFPQSRDGVEVPSLPTDRHDVLLAIGRPLTRSVKLEEPLKAEAVKHVGLFFDAIPNDLLHVPADIQEPQEGLEGRNTNDADENSPQELPDEMTRYLKEIGTFPLLTPLGEVVLGFRRLLGDREARERLIVSNLRSVTFVARSVASRCVPLLDLKSFGNIGLIRAVDKFKPWMGRLISYSHPWIQKRIVESLPVYLHAASVKKRALDKCKRLKKECEKAGINDPLDPEIDEEAIANRIGWDPAEVRDLLRILRDKNESLEALIETGRIQEHAFATHDPHLADTKFPYRGGVSQLMEDIKREMAPESSTKGELEKAARNIAIFYARKAEGRTLEFIADKFEITLERVRQITFEVLKIARRLIEKENGQFDPKENHGRHKKAQTNSPTIISIGVGTLALTAVALWFGPETVGMVLNGIAVSAEHLGSVVLARREITVLVGIILLSLFVFPFGLVGGVRADVSKTSTSLDGVNRLHRVAALLVAMASVAADAKGVDARTTMSTLLRGTPINIDASHPNRAGLKSFRDLPEDWRTVAADPRFPSILEQQARNTLKKNFDLEQSTALIEALYGQGVPRTALENLRLDAVLRIKPGEDLTRAKQVYDHSVAVRSLTLLVDPKSELAEEERVRAVTNGWKNVDRPVVVFPHDKELFVEDTIVMAKFEKSLPGFLHPSFYRAQLANVVLLSFDKMRLDTTGVESDRDLLLVKTMCLDAGFTGQLISVAQTILMQRLAAALVVDQQT